MGLDDGDEAVSFRVRSTGIGAPCQSPGGRIFVPLKPEWDCPQTTPPEFLLIIACCHVARPRFGRFAKPASAVPTAEPGARPRTPPCPLRPAEKAILKIGSGEHWPANITNSCQNCDNPETRSGIGPIRREGPQIDPPHQASRLWRPVPSPLGKNRKKFPYLFKTVMAS